MPFGRYPERVKDFRKWAAGLIDKADISDRATSFSRVRLPRAQRKFHVKRGRKPRRKRVD